MEDIDCYIGYTWLISRRVLLAIFVIVIPDSVADANRGNNTQVQRQVFFIEGKWPGRSGLTCSRISITIFSVIAATVLSRGLIPVG